MQPESPRAELVDDAEIEIRDAVIDGLTRRWWTFLLRGILSGLLGIAALFWPTGGISLLVQLVGLLLVLDGALTLFGFGRGGLAGSLGIGSILIGLVLLIWPEGTARITFFLLGAWAFISGVGYLSAWWRMNEEDPERQTTRNVGIAALAIGLALVFWPGSGLVALGWAIAFAALAVSAVMFVVASRFRRANHRLKARTVNR